MTEVITCTDCDGLTFTLVGCPCLRDGDVLTPTGAGDAPVAYPSCQLCAGAGTLARGCLPCRQRGRRRAQLVLTVANLDTGQVASRNVVPGSLEPTPHPHGGWELSLAPVLAELAEAVGARQLTAVDARQLTAVDGLADHREIPVWLPDWRPDLPEGTRREIEAAAIAGRDNDPWRVYVGRSEPAGPPPDPDQRLARLCQVADQLCLDLVVEARRSLAGGWSWDIRYEVPGAGVPTEARDRGADLASAVVATTVADAFDGLPGRSLGAPAYRIRPQARPPAPPQVFCDLLERALELDLQDGAIGVQAIWRGDRWWHTRLQPGAVTTVLRERDTGQLTEHEVTELLRSWEPPIPAWRGNPLPYVECPDCVPGSTLRRCLCTLGGNAADPGCAACSGAGYAASSLPCPSCRGGRRLHLAVEVTVTDLRGRVEHLSWQPTLGEPATLVGTQPGGKPVYAVPDRYRLARLARSFGVRPEDLTELDTGHEIGQDLRDGIVTVSSPTGDPVVEYVLGASRGLPAARLLVLAAVPEAPGLAQTIRLAHGLGLGVAVSVENHRLHAGDPTRLHGERWQVDIVGADPDLAECGVPLAPSLEAALAACHRYLGNDLRATVPADPATAIPVPQAPAPVAVDDPSALIGRLGYHYAGRAVTVCLRPEGCRVYLHEPDGPRQLVRAGTLTAAVAALGLRPS
jgi:hypothetical protein